MYKIRKVKFQEHPVLKNLELDFCDKDGKAVDSIIFAGENGAGKSTIVKMLYGVASHDVKCPMLLLKKMKEYFDVAIMLAPGLIKAIPEYVDVFEDEMIEKIYEWKLPVQVCEKELFTDIIHSIIEGTYDEERTLERLKVEYDKTVERLTK